MTRTVTVVLVSADGAPRGALPPFEVSVPWWQEVDEIADRCGVQVLRLLTADRAVPPGGHVVYLAQADGPVGELAPVDITVGPHPQRAAYAEAGGPAASIAWARAALGDDITAHQRRTWNLSAIWRLDRDGEPVAWLKQVPSFFAHEPEAIRLLTELVPGLVPSLIGVGPQGRMLLAHIDGEDRYGAGADLCERVAEAFHPVQAAWIGRAGGPIPHDRLAAGRFARIAAPYVESIDGLRELIDDLPRRLAAIATCGLPDTLMHGDLHPGNVRTGPDAELTIMDWGDCTIGHPGFDILRLTGGLTDPGPLLDRWAARWQRTVPGCDPLRAVRLLRPVAELRRAAVNASFLEAIEPGEWLYHAADVPAHLAAAASMVGE